MEFDFDTEEGKVCQFETLPGVLVGILEDREQDKIIFVRVIPYTFGIYTLMTILSMAFKLRG